VPRSSRPLALATALVLVSGGFMLWAGSLLAKGEVSRALWITLPGGVIIEVAFALLRRADAAVGARRPTGRERVRVEGGILLAGAVMVFAGYAGEAWSEVLTVPLVLLGGVTILSVALDGRAPENKRRLVQLVERYMVNPPTKAALLLGIHMPLVLLETTGCQTGKPRRTPVMNGLIGDDLWVVAEHGRHPGYVRNLIANPRVRVKRGRSWTEGTAEVLSEDDPLARAGWIAEQLSRSKRMELLATRAFCVDPVTVRVALSPTESTPAQPADHAAR
jgi:deazaflavin-dependent oxidoreductase (nitroreductase family)